MLPLASTTKMQFSQRKSTPFLPEAVVVIVARAPIHIQGRRLALVAFRRNP